MEATHNFLDVSQEDYNHAYFMKQALLMVRIIELPPIVEQAHHSLGRKGTSGK